jgi:hypothetical protein
VQIEIFENNGSRGSDGALIGKNIFYISLYSKKSFFFKPTRPISIKLDANYPCMKGIQVYLDKEPGPHQRGDNNKNANIGWDQLKIFSRTNNPEKLRFT